MRPMTHASTCVGHLLLSQPIHDLGTAIFGFLGRAEARSYLKVSIKERISAAVDQTYFDVNPTCASSTGLDNILTIIWIG